MVLKDLSHGVCRAIAGGAGTEVLSKEILKLIKDHFDLRGASLYLQGWGQDYVSVPPAKGEEREAESRVLNSDPFTSRLKYSKRPMFQSHLSSKSDDRNDQAVRDRMCRVEAEVTVPLLVGEDLVGFLNLGRKVDDTSPSEEEVQELSEFFSQIAMALQNRILCEKLRHSQAKMRRTDRLALLGTLTAGLAHEIRNPLVSIKTYFQLLPERYDDQEFRERFQKVAADEVDRISRLVEELLRFARPSDPNFRRVNLRDLIKEVITLLESTAERRGVELRGVFNVKESPVILCDPEQVKQVLLNLAHNGFDAVDGKGAVSLRLRHDREEGAAGFIHIEIQDNGVGMTSDQLEKLFIPFYTTKSSGTGLGLAISRQIIEEHLGSISVESRPGRGSTFCIHLPKNPPLHERRKERSPSDQADRKEMVH